MTDDTDRGLRPLTEGTVSVSEDEPTPETAGDQPERDPILGSIIGVLFCLLVIVLIGWLLYTHQALLTRP